MKKSVRKEIEPLADEEEDVDEVPSLSSRKQRKTLDEHVQHAISRASMYELDAYKDRGTPQPMKHTRAIHKKYCQLIDRHVGKSTDNGTTKSPKVPEPKAI